MLPNHNDYNVITCMSKMGNSLFFPPLSSPGIQPVGQGHFRVDVCCPCVLKGLVVETQIMKPPCCF